MTLLTESNLPVLQHDLESLKSSSLVGVLVGRGSMVLRFSNTASVLVQCPFEVRSPGANGEGDGEVPETSLPLFSLLNEGVVDVHVDGGGRVTLDFGAQLLLRLVPRNDGLESYVLSTSQGTFPV